MKCHNCNKTLKKIAKPTVYKEKMHSVRGLELVTWEQRWRCPSCPVKVGVAVNVELLQPKPPLTKKKEEEET